MGKSKHTKVRYERFEDDETDNWNSDHQEHRRKLASKRLQSALKTRNIDQLLELDEDDLD